MYEAHFGLKRRPFASVPQVAQFFPAAAIESARSTLLRCIQRAEGAGMVVGPSGTGKTLLCQILAEQCRREFAVALLFGGGLSNRRALLQAILYELGRPYRGMDEGELRLALIDFLTVDDGRPEAMALIVDEAHTLPLRLLDEIRMLTNLAVAGQSKTRLVLAGAPVLEERLASPKLESFSQRMVARCYLEPLNRSETEQYVRAQLSAAGAVPGAVFIDEACRAVYRATEGVPRLINQVCDHAMLLAFAGGRAQIDAAGIEEAWGDLQQLPTPWSGENRSAVRSGVVEFGRLEDEPLAVGPVAAEQPAGEDSSPPLGESPISADGGNPVVRLEQIQQALADLEEDFEPAGAIGPEVELVFDECINPFSEPFEEETVLVDRYGAPGAAGPKKRPSIHLEPIPEQTLPPTYAAPAPGCESQDAYGDFGEDPYVGLQAAVDHAAQEPAATTPGPDLASGQSAGQEPVETADAECEAEWDEEPETVLLRRTQTVVQRDAQTLDDRDMILIEDGYEAVEAPHTRRVAVVRRQEYGQLFARLRKSC
ncbi:MAG: AAA family ATPase [Pirellulales bacterium]|nr:AAA family ATPase [Pirellulales bacterium]